MVNVLASISVKEGKRADFIAKKTAELKKAGELKGFDAQVENLIREQAAPKGIAY